MSKDTFQDVLKTDFYQEYKKIMNGLIFEPGELLAVAVSGGVDSMALMYVLATWAYENNHPIHVLTIDHGFREEAKVETQEVKNIAESLGLSCDVISLKLTCKSSLQEQARLARYEAFKNICKRLSIKKIFIAHHGDDQMETFFQRLSSGSGLDGLSAMSLISYDDDFSIIRPFLSFNKSDLNNFIEMINKNYFEDISNRNRDFSRVRFRQFLEEEGFSAERYTRLTLRLARASKALDEITNNVFDAICSTQGWGDISCDFEKFEKQSDEIQIRLLEKMLRFVRGKGLHFIKLSSLEMVHENLLLKKERQTLHGCFIDYDGERIICVREPVDHGGTLINEDYFIWDDRLIIKGAKGFFIRSYEQRDAFFIKKQENQLSDIEASYRLNFPTLCDAKQEFVFTPYLMPENGSEFSFEWCEQKLAL